MVRQEPRFTPLESDATKKSQEEVEAANARLKFERGQQADESYFESVEKQMLLESQKQLEEIREKLAAYAKEGERMLELRRNPDRPMAEAAGKRLEEIAQLIGQHKEELESIRRHYPDMAEEAGRLLNKSQSVEEFIARG